MKSFMVEFSGAYRGYIEVKLAATTLEEASEILRADRWTRHLLRDDIDLGDSTIISIDVKE